MELVAMLPWWVGVVLAAVSYLVLHQMSATPKPGSLQPGQIGDFVIRSMLAMLAFYGQFIVPVLCLVGALGSFLKRRKRAAWSTVVAKSNGADALNGMSWREFEMLVGEAFRLQGYTITELGGAQPDGGVDLVLRKGTETFLVQCKQWKAYKVGVEVVRELYGVMASRGAAGGFVITSGSFTADAQAFVKGLNVKLVDGPKLFGLIQQAKGSLKGAATPAAASTPITASARSRVAGRAPRFVRSAKHRWCAGRRRRVRMPARSSGVVRSIPPVAERAEGQHDESKDETLPGSRPAGPGCFVPIRPNRLQMQIQRPRWSIRMSHASVPRSSTRPRRKAWTNRAGRAERVRTSREARRTKPWPRRLSRSSARRRSSMNCATRGSSCL